jgi:two-component system response regulator
MILLMEDSPEDEALTRRALKKNNIENMVFFMRDGLEVLRRLGADVRTRLLPVVILTSSNEKRDLIEGYKSGANSYIRKPVDFNQFAEAIRQLGLYWLVLNEPPPQ